ncbi:hypothetical protein HL667_19425 [Bradyrhizobium sp. 83012]|uniref:Uncharacterized protein n=1 Tax=Bradyrhizobium aeschynomenes TaxID=2734909 RepID=A0ABX2CH54_9BRAD|nr:hypothetical protein [Bradyrhizobium aeschynomenes]NPU11416.1 hypothetical protein [Bradyrhizobium aeschynomenes]NPU67183.1 hypothetical protein [Bradyrhizobium aeschynomenes]NPV22046.1 hypothetical protein [Bradyrhizobium aeschynomenes]
MQERIRVNQTLTLHQRLTNFAECANKLASRLPIGPEKDAALQRARQADNAVAINDWISPQGAKAR